MFSFILVLIIFFLVIESVRRGILETKYSLIWIALCVALGILSISKPLLEGIASFLGIYYAPSMLFMFGLLFVLIMLFDMTRRISKMNHQVITLAQEHAVQIERMQKEIDAIKGERK
jgi:hypothetical protein